MKEEQEKLKIFKLLEQNNIETSDIKDYEILSFRYGIYVIRIITKNQKTYIVKTFDKDQKEINNYKLLEKLKIKTIKFSLPSSTAIVFEDLDNSNDYKLAVWEDLFVTDVIKGLATWFKKLHTKGRDYLCSNDENLDDFLMLLINEENILFLKTKTNYENEDFWHLFLNNITTISDYMKTNRTITHNDFYFGNVVVSKDKKDAFMFDYDLLGEGLAAYDIYLVLKNLNTKFKSTFLDEYGEYSEIDYKIVDIFYTLRFLISEYKEDEQQSEAFQEAINKLQSNMLYEDLKIVTDYLN